MKSQTLPDPLVSVVIPTRLRPELVRAIASAQAQAIHGAIEVVVVVDTKNAPADPSPEVAESLSRVSVVWLKESNGAAAARNEGVRAASGKWIAFLDDDDEWESCHVSSALDEAGVHPDQVVVATRALQVVDGKRLSAPTPTHAKRRDELVGDYLFKRRSPSIGRPSLFTSTLVIEKEVATKVPWKVGLRRHQDWDWLLRLEEAGVAIVQSTAVTTRIWVGSDGSISASGDWRTSLEWVRQRRSSLSRRAYADFLAAQTLRYAIQSRSLRGIGAVTKEVVRSGAVPWPGSLLFALGALLPRRGAFRLLEISRTLRRRKSSDY